LGKFSLRYPDAPCVVASLGAGEAQKNAPGTQFDDRADLHLFTRFLNVFGEVDPTGQESEPPGTARSPQRSYASLMHAQ
jgi:hypothetical protein